MKEQANHPTSGATAVDPESVKPETFGAAPVSTGGVAEQSSYNHPTAPSGSDSRKWILLAVAAALLIIAIVVVSVLLANRQTNSSNATGDQPAGGNQPSNNQTAGQPDASGNYTGTGMAVAIFDNGFNKNHVALEGKIVEEICVGFVGSYIDDYGNRPENLCPEGATPVKQEGNIAIYRGEGVASDCTPRLPNTEANLMLQNCMHGTAMAGIVAMNPRTITTPQGELQISGTAPGAKLIVVQVYSYIPPQNGRAADLYPAGNSNNEFKGSAGTSEAAPYVAGAFATLRQKYPQASVNQLVQLFQETGVPVTDTRQGFTVGAKPLIQIQAALERRL